MATVITAHLSGAAELKRAFSAASILTASTAGLMAALPVISRAAVDSANNEIYSKASPGERRTRQYINSLRVGGEGNYTQVNPAANEIIFGSYVPHAEFIENGTEPHEIRPVNARALRFAPVVGRASGVSPTRKGARILPRGTPLFRGRGGRQIARPGSSSYVFATVVHHPGTRAYHVLEHALDDNQNQITEAYIEAFMRTIGRLGA